uniref:Uncharacterized protein n=1 Tax=viral metagenome TaxID=1070528 RepID=A0A6C0KUU4_9ZZZZ
MDAKFYHAKKQILLYVHNEINNPLIGDLTFAFVYQIEIQNEFTIGEELLDVLWQMGIKLYEDLEKFKAANKLATIDQILRYTGSRINIDINLIKEMYLHVQNG